MANIQGRPLRITFIGCSHLRRMQWIGRQDPYVVIEYGTTRFHSRTCTDGDQEPTFSEDFTFTMIESVMNVNVQVWNSNTIMADDFIGSGEIPLYDVLRIGRHDASIAIRNNKGRHTGDVRLILDASINGDFQHQPLNRANNFYGIRHMPFNMIPNQDGYGHDPYPPHQFQNNHQGGDIF